MKILIIQQKMIGDVLTSSILFEAIRKKYPEAELHYLIYPHTKPVIENNPFIDKVISFHPQKYKNPFNFLKFLFKIRKEKYQVVIDVYSKANSAIITAFTNAEMRISYKKWYTSFLYNRVFNRNIKPEIEAGVAIEKRLQFLKPLNLDPTLAIKPKIYLTEEESLQAKNILDDKGLLGETSLFMISVLGSSPEKTYPAEYLAQLLDVIVQETSGNLLFNYIPSQTEKALEVYNHCLPVTQQHIHLKIFGKSLREFMALTSYCDAMIGNEGGAINMAKALKIPTFAIFSPSIKRINWNIYEDGLKQVSTHLEDYFPEEFKNKSKQQIRKKTPALYKKFKPHFIKPYLITFLERLK
ncbi:glycosyltransferase family 9 protein [uncultured Salegentibacter sp.]|uniref:glycosyltransferase family 9 protein n=1 Tax=uncultured Salegentibacter sp. TaxID=259320 RepID=UPI0030D993FD